MPRSKKAAASNAEKCVRALVAAFEKLRIELLRSMRAARSDEMSHLVGEDPDDSIYRLDIVAAKSLLPLLDEYISPLGGAALVAEGIKEKFIGSKSGGKDGYRLLIDPVDGTRCLMYGKRSAWALAAVAPDKGPETRLSDAVASVTVELPTPRAAFADSIWAIRGQGVWGQTLDLRTGKRTSFTPKPSKAAKLQDGYAMISRFFPGGKDIIAAVEEDFMLEVVGPPVRGKATVFEDQYVCTGGQMLELAMGRDRFCADIRNVVYGLLQRERGFEPGHCCRPHDAAALLVAQESGVIITDIYGAPLDAPFDTRTDIDWIGYANPQLRKKLEKPFRAALKKHGLV